MNLRPDLYQNPKLVTVFGGSGFVGRQVVATLTKRGYRVRVAVRHPEKACYMWQIGEVGQMQMFKTNVCLRESVARALVDTNAAVFLTGSLCSAGKNNFESVLINGAGNVAEFSAAFGIPLVHISSLNAKTQSCIPYIISKYEGERIVKSTHPTAIILRPSLIFGPNDNSLNKFSDMVRFLPVLPLFGDGRTQFQPVYVGDVAEMVVRAVSGEIPSSKVYELGGPTILTLRKLIEKILSIIHRQRAFISIPFFLIRFLRSIFDFLGEKSLIPTFVITRQVSMLQYDSVISDSAISEGRTLRGVGIKPQGLDAILASYLWRFRLCGQFSRN
ncbi:MAG: NADH dehydrogenase [Candidatus Tokpelaia sp. JSC188]|nr:MAG: NADH dehydrogenase [Candidatus Tokpelaia sp. JSC188]